MGTPTSGKTVVEMIAEEVSALRSNQIQPYYDELSSAVSTLETKIAEAKRLQQKLKGY